jgi:hypothetical protein
VAFGQIRRVCWDSAISVDGVRYSVPHVFVDERVWARWSGDELIVNVIDIDTGRARSPVTHADNAAGPGLAQGAGAAIGPRRPQHDCNRKLTGQRWMRATFN